MNYLRLEPREFLSDSSFRVRCECAYRAMAKQLNHGVPIIQKDHIFYNGKSAHLLTVSVDANLLVSFGENHHKDNNLISLMKIEEIVRAHELKAISAYAKTKFNDFLR